jgi:hypothetical protein
MGPVGEDGTDRLNRNVVNVLTPKLRNISKQRRSQLDGSYRPCHLSCSVRHILFLKTNITCIVIFTSKPKFSKPDLAVRISD